MKTLTLGLAAALSLTAAAETTVHFGGGGHVSVDGIKGAVTAYGEGWGGSATGGKVHRLPKDGRIAWEAKGPKGLEIACTESAAQEGNAVRFRAAVRSLADAKPECVAFAFNIDAPSHVGWTWTAETPK